MSVTERSGGKMGKEDLDLLYHVFPTMFEQVFGYQPIQRLFPIQRDFIGSLRATGKGKIQIAKAMLEFFNSLKVEIEKQELEEKERIECEIQKALKIQEAYEINHKQIRDQLALQIACEYQYDVTQKHHIEQEVKRQKAIKLRSQPAILKKLNELPFSILVLTTHNVAYVQVLGAGISIETLRDEAAKLVSTGLFERHPAYQNSWGSVGIWYLKKNQSA